MLKYTIKIDKTNVVDSYINIPIDNLFYPNAEQYVEQENNFDLKSLNLINPTIDFEKVKIHPISAGNIYNDVNYINFKLFFYINNSDWSTETTSLSDVGFTGDDVINKRKQLEKTFLRLSFYDSNNLKTQNLLFYSTIFIDSGKLYGEYVTGSTISDLKMEFNVNNPKISKDIKSFEGFYIYLFSDDIPKNR